MNGAANWCLPRAAHLLSMSPLRIVTPLENRAPSRGGTHMVPGGRAYLEVYHVLLRDNHSHNAGAVSLQFAYYASQAALCSRAREVFVEVRSGSNWVCSRKIMRGCQVNIFVFLHTFICYSPTWKGNVINNIFFIEEQNIPREIKNASTRPFCFSIFSFLSTSTAHTTKALKARNFKHFVHILN